MWTQTPIRPRAAALLVGLLLALALVPLVGPTAPAAALGDGPIVYASEVDGDFEIYKINPDGTGKVKLTNNGVDDMGPVWFGTGKIAFASDRDGDLDIYTMNADGSGVTQITQSPGYDARPTWSPDGTKIAFVSARSGKNQIHIQSVAAPGASSTQRTFVGTNTAPSWGAGGRITFTRKPDGQDNEIMVMNADGTGLIAVTTNTADDRNSRWVSPTKVIFQSDLAGAFQIVTTNTNGTGRTLVTNNALQPTISPTGARMAFIRGAGSAQELMVSNANGSGQQTRLTFDGGKDETPDWGDKPLSFVPREQEIKNVVVTPTGLKATITFKTTRPTDDARVELRHNGTGLRWAFDQGAPTRNHTLVVTGLTPGLPYTVKILAPKVLTAGEVVVNTTTTTHRRRVQVTGGWAEVIDDSDNTSCGEYTLGMGALGSVVEWGDYSSKAWEVLCSDEIYDASDQTITRIGVTADEMVVGFGAREDDYWGTCATFDDCADSGQGSTTVSLLDDVNEVIDGSGAVHVLPTDGDVELVWHFTYTVRYVP